MDKPERLPEQQLQRQSEIAADLLSVISESVGDDDEIRADMVEAETGFFEAIDIALEAIRNCEVQVVGCENAVAKLEHRKTRNKNRISVLRAAIEQAMVRADMTKVQRPTATISVCNVKGKAIVSDQALIPVEFWKRQAPKLDMTALNKAVQSGTIPGAHLGNGTLSLSIRRA